MEEIFQKVQLKSWLWMKHKSVSFHYSLMDWILNPMLCIRSHKWVLKGVNCLVRGRRRQRWCVVKVAEQMLCMMVLRLQVMILMDEGVA